MSVTWFVAHTQPLKEQIAEQHLKDQGYQVYLPRIEKICRHARKVQKKQVPLFPRYLFVGMDIATMKWRSVNGTRGVSYLLMRDSVNPAEVFSHVIADLRSQENTEGVVPITSLGVFDKGEKVRVLEGVFKDQVASFDALDDEFRVRILLTFMGRETNIVLPLRAIEVA